MKYGADKGMIWEDANTLSWLKEVAPSKELLKWFGHDLKKYTEFRVKYMETEMWRLL